MTNIIKAIRSALSTAALCAMAAQPIAAQNFSKIYDAMPDMTLDQTYSALINYQKANPYLSCVYIQLGSVSEKKMVMYDPLRETESIKFWGKNAELFYGNLTVYYTEGDVRSEFYENLHIPFSGKRITDDDLWKYVEFHKQKCKNIADSTSLIYSAIESSRSHYNQSIETFKGICDEYLDRNEMLLRYDAKLASKLGSLKRHFEECEKQFAEYKRLTKLFPVANYTQIYEKVPIETYRLDGLTNSDFFANRFTMWDYSAWVAEFENTFNNQIVPLRNDVAAINKAYMAARSEFEAGGVVTDAMRKPYDEYFLFRLGHFDVGSAVDALFDYLEATREMIVMAGDSLGRNLTYAPGLESRKMRRLSRLAQQARTAAEKRKTLAENATENKLARFADLFAGQYGGVAGMRDFLERDAKYCQSIIDQMSEATASYMGQAARSQSSEADIYSTSGGQAAPSVPLWVAMEPQSVTSKYISTHVARNALGQIAATAGYAKGNAQSWFVAGISANGATQWLLRPKGVNSVNKLTATTDGVLVSAIRQLRPAIIFIDGLGKEVSSLPSEAEIVDFMDRDGVSGAIFWTTGNDQSLPTLSMAAEGATDKSWTTALSGMAKAAQVSVTAGGFAVTGVTPDGELAVLGVAADGTLGEKTIVAEGIADILATQRVSSAEMGALVKTTDGKHKYLSYGIGQ